jgi:hypothetical protein
VDWKRTEVSEQLQNYSESQLNQLRTYGLEKQFFYIGKRVLVVQKVPADELDVEMMEMEP